MCEKIPLPDWSYSVSDIHNYFENIIKTLEKFVDNPPMQIYINKIESGITFKIKNRYCLKLLIPEAITLFGSTEKKIT